MTHHFEILGESMDPSIYYQTDAPYYRRITQLSFVDLFNRGLVYKANFPVNWCPSCMTALADAEVEYRDNVNKLNYITGTTSTSSTTSSSRSRARTGTSSSPPPGPSSSAPARRSPSTPTTRRRSTSSERS